MTCGPVLHAPEPDASDEPPTEPLLNQLYGLSETERRAFETVLGVDDPVEVDELATRLDRSRSTITRAMNRLVDEGLVERHRHCFDDGGYCHRYRPPSPEHVVTRFYLELNRRYAALSSQIDAFETDGCFPTE